MMDYRDLFEKYEKQAVPYRGICDEIKRIVLVIIAHMPSNDNKVNKVLCESFSVYKFVRSITIDKNLCIIRFFDDSELRELKFNCFYYGDDYSSMLYSTYELVQTGFSVDKIKKLVGTYKLSGACHDATLDYLKCQNNEKYKAITSLCVTSSGYSFFHSYVWNTEDNMIYDLARNIVMSKDDFDYLFVLQEISILNYEDYMSCDKENNSICNLLAMALTRLDNEKEKKLVNF